MKSQLICPTLLLVAALGMSGCASTHVPTWHEVAAPALDYKNDRSPGALAFAALVPDPQAYAQDIAEKVVRTLYKSPAEVPAFKTLELRIERWEDQPKGIAWKDGEPPERIIVNVNAYYLENYAAKGGNVAEEVRGILFHEMTHAYQHYTGMAPEAIEGVADLVRYKNGYQAVGHRKPGGSWTSSYKTTSFFFGWLSEQKGFSDFSHCFNQTGNATNPISKTWSWESATAACTGGGDLAKLWGEYQDWLQQAAQVQLQTPAPTKSQG